MQSRGGGDSPKCFELYIYRRTTSVIHTEAGRLYPLIISVPIHWCWPKTGLRAPLKGLLSIIHLSIFKVLRYQFLRFWASIPVQCRWIESPEWPGHSSISKFQFLRAFLFFYDVWTKQWIEWSKTMIGRYVIKETVVIWSPKKSITGIVVPGRST